MKKFNLGISFIVFIGILFVFESYAFSVNENVILDFNNEQSDFCSIANEGNCEVTPPVFSVTASGPTYMPAGTNAIQWQYNGNISNVQSITWWYKKVGNTGVAPYVIATGATGNFLATSDTYYSDPSTASSYFEIYVEVTTTSGATYTSGTYTIHKKGKYKLGGLLL